ncbi:MAG: MFS transporter [Gammaproteobacteria bacterium]|nr:MFS transporter [Gammaproteobacteria bacterium]
MSYWRFSGFYFFYFATLGALVPYFALYLHSLGFGPVDIGALMALLMISRIVAPVIWGWIADHREQRLTVVRLSSLLAVVSFSGVFVGTEYWWLAAVMLVFSLFWHGSLPLLEVFTMNHFGTRPGAYGRVRLWGSLGFIVSVAALGPIVDSAGPWWILPALLGMMTGILVYSLLLPESGITARAEHAGPFIKTMLRPEVFAFLLACFLMQAGHGAYYTFYTLYLEQYGYSKTVIGALWAFAVVCEIGVFLSLQHVFARIPLRQVLLASFLAAALRWWLIGHYPESLAILILAQALHAATFGSFHAAAMQMVHRFFVGRHQYRGQAVYGSASFGLGGALGSLYSGYSWAVLGPTTTFNIAALLALAAFAVAYLLPKTRI